MGYRAYSRRDPPQAAGKGGVLLAAKVPLDATAALIVGHLLGTEPVPTGLLAVVSTLAVVAAINDTNGGLLAFPWQTLPGAIAYAAAAPAATVLVGETCFCPPGLRT